jgi:hypothetical protein
LTGAGATDDDQSMEPSNALAALLAEQDPDLRWAALSSLVRERPDAARLAGEAALGDEDAEVREIAADLLGQVTTVETTSAQPIARILVSRLAIEHEPRVLGAIIVALGHASVPGTAGAVLPFAEHLDPEIRFDVAFAPLRSLKAEGRGIRTDRFGEAVRLRASCRAARELTRGAGSALVNRSQETPPRYRASTKTTGPTSDIESAADRRYGISP